MVQANQKNQKTPFWEKAIGAVGLVFLLSIVGFLLYEAVQPTTLPIISVVTEHIQAVEGGYLVEIEVKNSGESTAAVVEVEGTLKASDDPQAEPIESSTTTFDYIPSQSTRGGGLFFREDPNQYTLEVQAKGYIEP
jgi:uncharacterized protein (TIGR02588 family)